MGVIARPVGVSVIDDGEVYWNPAVSVDVLVVAGSALAALGLLGTPCITRACTKRRARL